MWGIMVARGVSGHGGGRVGTQGAPGNPGTAAFSRIKYLQRYGYEDQIAEFVNGLFLAAVDGKYQGDWSEFESFLERWEEEGIGLQFKSMAMPDQAPVPWAALEKPLARCKVALVTTGGVYVEGQTPFERGDPTHREIARGTPAEELRIWHPGYDIGPATADVNCIFPMDRLDEMHAEGVIGDVAETHYSFMGLINDTERLINDTAPEVARLLRKAGVDAVFLAST